MQRQQLLDMEKAFLQSINSELAMVRQHYQTVIGNEIDQLPDGKPFESNYSVTGDYFTVYNKSDQIGHVRDEKLRRDIIWAYSMMKGLLDSYQTNNDMLAKREQDMKDFRYSSKMVGLLDANTRSAELTQYAETLKTYHLEARAAVDSALESIDETLKHEKNWKV